MRIEIGDDRVVNEQGALFDGAPSPLLPHQGGDRGSSKVREAAIAARERSIQARFEEFHRENPRVYSTLVSLARRAVSEGRPRLGIGHLWEVARWELHVPTNGEPFRLNDHYRSRYSRLIMAREPDLAGYFETRELRA
jgi:hypothetical protein